MLIYSLSIKIERGFEDIIEAVIESGKLNILGFNTEFLIKEESISIVNIYNENEEILKNNLNIIEENIKGIAEYTYKIEELKSEEYLTSYMDFLKPFNIGDVTIVPNLKDFYNEECENPLYIAKQYAFGSGTHETTSLALEMIYEYSNNNDIISKLKQAYNNNQQDGYIIETVCISRTGAEPVDYTIVPISKILELKHKNITYVTQLIFKISDCQRYDTRYMRNLAEERAYNSKVTFNDIPTWPTNLKMSQKEVEWMCYTTANKMYGINPDKLDEIKFKDGYKDYINE